MPKSHRPSASSEAYQYERKEVHEAVIARDIARCSRLLAEGANPDVVDKNGWTPLHFAAQSQAPDLVDALIAAGAKVDVPDKHGNTPLQTAVFSSRGDGRVIKRLRAAGADPYHSNSHGVSPLSLARTIANFDVAQFFTDLPVA
jgi:ankyrin repeat protein